jgi:AmmeMemoRadiSam system protein B
MLITKEPRPSPIAGTWYSDNAAVLARQVDGFLSGAKLPELPGEVVGVFAPHAGLRYSGRTAGFAFRCVQGKAYDLVAVLSPLHGYHPAPYLTSAHPAYITPLGSITVDRDAQYELDSLLASDGNPGLIALANDTEHSLEIELPFLQRAVKEPFKLLPLMVRNPAPGTARLLGEALVKVLANRNALLVASSDLSHFFTEQQANELDATMLRKLESFSPEGMLSADLEGTGFACGVAAAAATLIAARALGANLVRVLHHSTSADETHDRQSVVGYGAAVILKTS